MPVQDLERVGRGGPQSQAPGERHWGRRPKHAAPLELKMEPTMVLCYKQVAPMELGAANGASTVRAVEKAVAGELKAGETHSPSDVAAP